MTATPQTSSTAPLLTGATGFAGGHMLAKILREEQRPVFCLVRRSAIGMFARIEANLRSYDLWDERFSAWIRPVAGDLGHPTLGLSDTAFEALAQRVDTIYHLGGNTNWVKPYAQLRDVNVGSTFALVRLAGLRRGTRVAFLSSLGVYSDLTAPNADTAPLGAGPLLNGYAESKRAAEMVLPVLRASGNPYAVFRTASLSGSVETGIGHANRTIEMFIASCLQMGKAPDADLFFWDLLPVDFVVDFIWATTRSGAADGQALNVVLSDRRERQRVVQNWLEVERGVELVSYEQWRSEMLTDSSLPIFALRAFFPAEGPIANGCLNDGFRRATDAVGLATPTMDSDVLERCVSFVEGLGTRPRRRRAAWVSAQAA